MCYVLYVVFWAFITNCENQELIWLNFHNFPHFIKILNSKWNAIIGTKLVQPTIPCRVCFWPTIKERLLTPDVGYVFWKRVYLEKHTLKIERLLVFAVLPWYKSQTSLMKPHKTKKSINDHASFQNNKMNTCTALKLKNTKRWSL